VEDPEFAVTQLAQTTMRSELGMYEADKFVHGHLLPVGWEVLPTFGYRGGWGGARGMGGCGCLFGTPVHS